MNRSVDQDIEQGLKETMRRFTLQELKLHREQILFDMETAQGDWVVFLKKEICWCQDEIDRREKVKENSIKRFLSKKG